MKEQIEELVKKAAEAKDSADAMRFSQAAQNAGNTFAVLESIRLDERNNILHTSTKELAELFCMWKLPSTVSADLCATKSGETNRSGTNLLTVAEAKQFFDSLREIGRI